ncbi:MAG: SDR family NAD(P)-dependent oxidoreductase [Ignavibacteriaceae bacterium]
MYFFTKRLFDILISLIALILFLPVFLFVSFIIIISSGFPVFYLQERVGKDWEPFKIIKFRTMKRNADKIGPGISLSNDGRITFVGKFLRRSKIDEMPQFINVLLGNMSLIGPRPELKRFADYYPIEYSEILKVRPGIIDYVSIIFRNESDLFVDVDEVESFYLNEVLPQKLKLCKNYISDISFSKDIKTILKIVKTIYFEVRQQSSGSSFFKKTLIIGAGNNGEQIIRDILSSKKRKLCLTGLIYNESGISDVKVISPINDISNDLKVRIKNISDIEINDLIGRQAISIDSSIIGTTIKNKKVLITGAAGSIGSEIARQVIAYGPREIGILDINESELVNLEIQLRRSFNKSKIKMYLCDISLLAKVESIFEEFEPEIIYHAAAYKHVPVLEHFPDEAARVNVLGTYNLAETAKNVGVENFILISTDKAINPISILGASKRIAEYIVTGIGASSESKFIAVRFGNVIGSRGSAVPIFIDQLKNGGPITVTHPEMRRYFMTIPEAVSLVLQASANGENNDVFSLDMGSPVKIIDIVRDLISLTNLVEGEDIKIEYTGIREGEKLFEENLTSEGEIVKTSHEKIFKSKISSNFNQDSVEKMIEHFSGMNAFATKSDWVDLFKYYVPTFNPSNGNDTQEIKVIEGCEVSELFNK